MSKEMWCGCRHDYYGKKENCLSGTGKFAYIAREGKKWEHKADQLVLVEGEYPSWAHGDGKNFWRMVTRHDKGRQWDEIEIDLDHDMNEAERIASARGYVEKLVPKGCAYTLAIHNKGDSGNENWHAHILMYQRQDDGLHRKPEIWFKRAAANYRNARTGEMGKSAPETGGCPKLKAYFGDCSFRWKARKMWAEHYTAFCQERGYDFFMDHRSYKQRGIDLQPKKHRGKACAQNEREIREGKEPSNEYGLWVAAENARILHENGEKIIADPGIAINFLTQHSSTFSERDLQKFLLAQTADADQYQAAFSAVMSSAELYQIGDKYTSISLLQTEALMVHQAQEMAQEQGHEVDLEAAEKVAGEYGLTEDQKGAFDHILQGGDCVAVTGLAGSGKSYMMGAVREVYERQGYRVMGAALAGQAAEGLEQGAGIKSSTLHALLYRLESGKTTLSDRDVLVLDEAGMVGTRQYAKLAEECKLAGVKLINIGDFQQLQSIEAGGAFKAIVSRVGQAEMFEVKRHREEWMRQATQNFGRGNTKAALKEYAHRGQILTGTDREETMSGMVEAWRRAGTDSKIMLAFTRADVDQLNDLARQAIRDQLGEDISLSTERGRREFAAGDQVIFGKNEYRDLGVKNGTRGVLESVDAEGNMRVRLAGDQERVVEFNVANYGHIDHGYATTIHKSQGATYDQAFVLASRHFDQHTSYVAMSRHRDQVQMFVDRSEIRSDEALYNICSRERQKDLAIDFALSRGIDLDEQQAAQLREDALAQAQQFQQAAQEQQPPAPVTEAFDAQAWMIQQQKQFDLSPEALAGGIQSGNLTLDAYRLSDQQRQAVHEQARATLLENPELQAEYQAHQQGQLADHRMAKVEAFHAEKLAEHDEKWTWLNDPAAVKEAAYEARHGQEYIDARALQQDLQKQHQDLLNRRAAVQDGLANCGTFEIAQRRQLKKSAVELDEQERQVQARMSTTEKKLEKMRDTTNVQGFQTRMVGQRAGEREWVEKQTATVRSREYYQQRQQAELVDGKPAQQQRQAQDHQHDRGHHAHGHTSTPKQEQRQPEPAPAPPPPPSQDQGRGR